MILTVLGQIYAINFFPSRLGLDWIGSHIEENYIGIIHQRCCLSNQAETVFRAITRLEIVKSRLPLLGSRAQWSSWANLGGVRRTENGISTQPPGLWPLQVVQSILCGLGHEIRRIDAEIVSFEHAIQWILDLPVNPRPGPGHFFADASGSQMLTQLVAFQSQGQ
jgi:hypothetical protein